MKGLIQIAGGSIRGRDHVFGDKPNHDAFCWHQTKDFTVAVVCDGCGSGNHSEVGAKLGARIAVQAISDNLKRFSFAECKSFILEQAKQDIISQLRVLARSMSGSFSEVVMNYFLFTIVGTIITKQGIVVFSIGDGVTLVNGERINATYIPDASNAPPYIAYWLTGSGMFEQAAMTHLSFKYVSIEWHEFDSILIGSDGVQDFIDAETLNLPGKDKPVGPVSQFWTENKHFENPDMIRRRLFLTNSAGQKINWEGKKIERWRGLLPDDTTLIVVKKVEEEANNEKET